MEKVILFYKFVPINDTETVMYWQRALCEKLGLKGRIIISKHGINGTLGGELKNLKYYTREMKAHSLFKGTQFKWSDGSANDFPRLSIKVRDEIVTFGAGDELQVDEHGVVGGGKHLKPEAVHKLLEERGEDVVFFDGRNKYEAEIGRFKNAVIPEVKNTRDFISELEDPKYDDIKDKPVVTYCTGGIRCEILSALMKKRGFKEVYQIDGGIVKYGEKYGDDGKWEGKLHIFDNRMVTSFSDKAKDIGSCVHCAGKTSNYENCANKQCNRLVLICKDCINESGKRFCENSCRDRTGKSGSRALQTV
jgi:UPF0176 protein